MGSRVAHGSVGGHWGRKLFFVPLKFGSPHLDLFARAHES